ncbi:uncharacterized protein LOC135472313 [Liolophura sinensis]|uniref:uncharacterized protein LOC135472313 n=1 Tax=Liolophura sinensis TaxID=3198878 RepID=UPI0031591BF3
MEVDEDTKKKTFTCRVCGRGFTRHDNWQRRHQTQHDVHEVSGESGVGKKKLFTCLVCTKNFTRRDSWLRHQRTHQPQTKRFICSTCRRAFFRRENLIHHQQRHETNKERVWYCIDCQKSFYRLWDWRTHQRGEHGQRPASSTTTNNNNNKPSISKARVSLEADESLKEKKPASQFEPDPIQPRKDVLPSGDNDVNSNVPDYDHPMCFILTGDPQALVEQMMAYLNEISEISSAYLRERYTYILDALDKRINPNETKLSYTRQARDRFVKYMNQLPVLGFNSGNYDLNLIKQQLYPHLVQSRDLEYVIKRNNNHMTLTTPQLKFLDIRNYLAPNYSYDKWVKAYDCRITEGKFCYSYIDSLAQLEETVLPPQHAFDNDLTHQPCTYAEYKTLQTVWREHGMRAVKDLLRWYNNLDVIPFMEAAEKMSVFY